jgi:lysophospholipase L1-like esterase
MEKNIWFIVIFVIIMSGAWYHYGSAKPKALNLVAIGDSLTYGTGDPAKKGYIKRVQARVEEKLDTPVRLSNYAVPGFTTENILTQLQDRKILKTITKADYLILYIGTNDFRKSAEREFYPLHLEKIDEGKIRFSKNLHTILKKLRNENATAPILVLGLYQPYVEYPNQDELLAVIEHWNMTIVETTEDFHQTTFIPTLDLFQNKPKEKYFKDSIHPNPAGYELIAERVLKNGAWHHPNFVE